MKIALSCILFFISNSSIIAQNLVWAERVGGTTYDAGKSIVIDGSGNIYAIGSFTGVVDFDPSSGLSNLTSAGGEDIFIQKLDAAGNFLWAKRIGGISYDKGNSITVDGSGNVYATGFFSNTVDFDPNSGVSNLVSAGGEDIFIQKLDAAGNLIWAKKMGGTGSFDHGFSIVVDGSGNVYTTGVFQVTVDFDPNAGTSNLTSAGNRDIFIQKLDAAGNLVWAKRMGGNGHDYGLAIDLDGAGNIYTTGTFEFTVDFNPNAGASNLISQGGDDIFIQKLDAAGNLGWAKSMGGIYDDEGLSIALDGTGNVYTTGDFRDTVDFDPNSGVSNLITGGSRDIFVQKLDAGGNLVWAKSMEGAIGNDYGNSITVDGFGGIYITGRLGGSVDFDPTLGVSILTPMGGEDIFIQKLDAAGNLVWAKSMGGTNDDYGSAIAADGLGNIYITGVFSDIVDFDPNSGVSNLTSQGNYDVFIQKLDSTTIVGVEMLQESKINLYPNPTTGQITIDLGDLSDVSIKVFAVNGQLIHQEENIHTTTYQFELKEVVAGVYFVEVQTEKGKAVLKVVKE